MARVNKTTKSVFADLVGSAEKFSAYDIFLDSNNPENPSNGLKKLMKDYREFIAAERIKLERIALIEELIMQIRSKENISDIKVMVVRGYIYARCAFYRKDVNTKDVRVLICSVDDLGNDKKNFDSAKFMKSYVNNLYKNEPFMATVREKIIEKMDEVIQKNETRLKNMNEAMGKPATEKKAATKKPAVKKPEDKVPEVEQNVEA